LVHNDLGSRSCGRVPAYGVEDGARSFVVRAQHISTRNLLSQLV
jgi:hypothetical protein